MQKVLQAQVYLNNSNSNQCFSFLCNGKNGYIVLSHNPTNVRGYSLVIGFKEAFPNELADFYDGRVKLTIDGTDYIVFGANIRSVRNDSNVFDKYIGTLTNLEFESVQQAVCRVIGIEMKPKYIMETKEDKKTDTLIKAVEEKEVPQVKIEHSGSEYKRTTDRKYHRFTDEEKAEIMKCYAMGMDKKLICDKYGIEKMHSLDQMIYLAKKQQRQQQQ